MLTRQRWLNLSTKVILIAGALLVAGITCARPVAAICYPSEPDWWFVENYELDTAQRPIGVGLWVRGVESQSPQRRAEIIIENNTGTQMVILAKAAPPGTEMPYPPPESPEGFVAIARFRASDFVSYTAAELQYVVEGFEDHNVRAPDRPDDVVVPEPQEIRILALFGDQLLEFPIRMTYQLNADYDPDNGKDGCYLLPLILPLVLIDQALEWSLNNPFLCLGPLILLVTGILLAKKARGGRKQTDPGGEGPKLIWGWALPDLFETGFICPLDTEFIRRVDLPTRVQISGGDRRIAAKMKLERSESTFPTLAAARHDLETRRAIRHQPESDIVVRVSLFSFVDRRSGRLRLEVAGCFGND